LGRLACRAERLSSRARFWIVDNGTIHRGRRAENRLWAQWPILVLVHLPIHASWLNQIAIFFSVLQRKVLKPDDFSTFDAAAERIVAFQDHYQQIAQPFEWRFIRRDRPAGPSDTVAWP